MTNTTDNAEQRAPQVVGSDDPKRPIEPREPQLPPESCTHPWARVGVISRLADFHLQCFDCGVLLKVNGQAVLIA